jgi:hypothetical protein
VTGIIRYQAKLSFYHNLQSFHTVIKYQFYLYCVSYTWGFQSQYPALCKSTSGERPEWFFNRPVNRSSCDKLTDEVLAQAQKLITDFYLVSNVAKLFGDTVGALR